jgi:AAA+ superfamily predicted ATPase
MVTTDSSDDDTWASIIVSDSVKERLLHHAVLALTLRRDLPFGTTALHGLILLFGPPGTGKTTLARGLPFKLAPIAGGTIRLVEINPHGLMSAEHGQSQQQVSRLLEEVVPGLADDGLPTVVLIDEVESMAVARAEASLSANPVDVHRATDAVLTALDRSASQHPNIVWVATSNFESALDAAFRSRADAAIEVPRPGAAGVYAILCDALEAFGNAYPELKRLAGSPGLREVAELASDLDGRRTRKLVIEAFARRRETTIDPNKLTIEDLREATAHRTEVL